MMRNKLWHKRLSFIALFFWVCISSWFSAGAKNPINDASIHLDSLPQKPDLYDFLSVVQKNHPVAQQAALLPKKAMADKLKAKGAFDPTIGGQAQQKYFGGKEYFSQIGSELKIPTWIGAEIKGGYETNRGAFLSPESNTPTGGLVYGGVSIPLGRGLFIDERRVGVQSADLKWQAAKAKQENTLNELLFEASLLYWDWFRTYHARETWNSTLENARQRYNATITSVNSGERPMVDTLDASVQIQNLSLGKLQADAEWQKRKIQLSAYVWDNSQTSYGFPENMQPPQLDAKAMSDPSSLLPAEGEKLSHPYINQLFFLAREIELQKKWAVDRFKPTINLQYIPLAEPIGSSILNQFSLHNYKWGMEVKVPLLYRKERADLQIAKVREMENALEISDKQAQLQTKLSANYAVWNNYRDQVRVLENTVRQYQLLYEAEVRLFTLGESSLFMVNMRELSYLQSRLKLVDMITKYHVALSEIYYAAGKMTLLAEKGN